MVKARVRAPIILPAFAGTVAWLVADYVAHIINWWTSASQSRGGAAPTTTRRVATGIVPDMTHQGEGVRVGSVQPGSGAESAGIKPGDRLLVLGGVKTSNLRALADALRNLAPGQTVDVEFARDTAVLNSRLRLGER